MQHTKRAARSSARTLFFPTGMNILALPGTQCVFAEAGITLPPKGRLSLVSAGLAAYVPPAFENGCV